ncbi:MAG: hypothetical protein ACOCUV_02715 [bacterium]
MKKIIILFLIFVAFAVNPLKSAEKDIIYIAIHYMPGVAHSSILEDCFTFMGHKIAKDTIIYDYDFIDQIYFYVKKFEKRKEEERSNLWCDIRLTMIILYFDQTYDIICISGTNYKEACIIYNGVIVKPNPELVWLVFNLVYDVDDPLTRRLLFDIKDK